MKTVLYGGYDKDDVHECLKAKDAQIATLEKELAAAKALLAEEGKQDRLSEVAQQPIMKENESLHQQISELEQQRLNAESRADEEKIRADKLADENEKLSAKMLEIKERLAAASDPDEDEAVERVLEIAQEQLDEMLESAEAESMQLHAAAKAAAERIIREAEERAKELESAKSVQPAAQNAPAAQNNAPSNSELVEAARQVEISTINDLQKLTLQVRKIKDCLEAFTATGIAQIEQTNSLISNAEKLVAKGKIPTPWNAQTTPTFQNNASSAMSPAQKVAAAQAATAASAPAKRAASGEGPSLASIVAMAAQLSESTDAELAEKNENAMNLDEIAKLAATLDYPPEATDMNQKMNPEELANIAESL